MFSTSVLIILCFKLGVEGIRVPTSWNDVELSSSQPLTSNYNNPNGWLHDPKKNQIFMPYFHRATDGPGSAHSDESNINYDESESFRDLIGNHELLSLTKSILKPKHLQTNPSLNHFSNTKPVPYKNQFYHNKNLLKIPKRLTNTKLKVTSSDGSLSNKEKIKVKPEYLLQNEGEDKIPTRPIYPGEGIWAKPGYKHFPYVKKLKTSEFSVKDNDHSTPEGYETFLNQEKNFNGKASKLYQHFGNFKKFNDFANNDVSETKFLKLPDPEQSTSHLSPGFQSNPKGNNKFNKHLENFNKHKSLNYENNNKEEFKPNYKYSAYPDIKLQSNNEKENNFNQVFSKFDKYHSAPGFQNNRKLNAQETANTNYAEPIDKSKNVELAHNPSEEDKKGFEIVNKGFLEESTDNDKNRKNNADEKEDDGDDDADYNVNEDDDDDEEEASKGLDDDEENFVPKRLYAQVRNYESEEHVPRSVLEPRLREVVKDSRIHTVYTEEGYEDGAYDHAGEEKQAEEDEAYEEPLSSGSDKIYHKVDPKFSKMLNKPIIMNFQKTSLSTDKMVKVEEKMAKRSKRSLNDFSKTISPGNSFRRVRRYTNEYPEVSADTEFIGKTKFEEAPPPPEQNKYPYYDSEGLNKDSPLRYAQNLNDIPIKTSENMAFYEQADKIKCNEIESDVNPIPKNVDNGEMGKTQTKTKRLGNLDEKLDCFKAKFFGENPFDSPFFKEDVVVTPQPLFKEFRFKIEPSTEPAQIVNVTLSETKLNEIIRNSSRQPKVSDLIFDLQNSTDTAPAQSENVPENSPLRMRRRKIRPPLKIKKHAYERGYNEYYRITTPNPKYIISEVYYKDEIKPNEQLNVFADIINNIKNSSMRDSLPSTSNYNTPIAVKLSSTSRRIKVPNYRKSKPNVIRTTTSRTNFAYGKHKFPTQNKPNQNFKPNQNYMKTIKHGQTVHQGEIFKFDPNVQKVHPNLDLLSDSTQHVGTVFPDRIKVASNKRPVSSYTTIDVPLNKFLVPGMKPPPSLEKPYIYSDFQLIENNLLTRRNGFSNHRMRRKRSTRFNYSEIKRRPTTKKPEVEDEEEDEEDDYVPHRPTSYHYDTKSDKIIYNKNQRTTTSAPEYVEVDYEEVEEKTPVTTTTTHRTVYHKDVLNKANGLTLVDFVTKLKTNPSYIFIPDPEPTEKTTTTTTTVSPEKTTPPQFLGFLEKLHQSDGYKKIEDEDAKSKKPKTTTTEAPEVEEEVSEEEQIPGNVQNSPGGQFNSGGPLQLFDISEYLPKTKNYSPRTSIDYSKYKTIERTTSRHNLSSRYNENKDELPLDSKNTNQKPLFVPSDDELSNEDDIKPSRPTKPERKATTTPSETTTLRFTSTTVTSPSTTTATTKPIMTRINFRSRKRPTTRRSKITTTTPPLEDPIQTQASTILQPTHRPATRHYPRRPRPKIRLKTTTPSIEEEASTESKRRTQRRLDDSLFKIPANHKAFYTPIQERIDTGILQLESQKRPRLVTPDIINYNRTRNQMPLNNGKIEPRKIDVEVFGNIDRKKKHGGNYIRDLKVLPDSEPKAFAIYNESKQNAKVENYLNNADSDGKNEDYDYDDEVRIIFNKRDGKKTAIIKDPNKRLYYYAPI